MVPILARPPVATTSARALRGTPLADALRDCRHRTLSLTADLDDAQWRVPYREGINPIAWELVHLAWFAEFWILRGPHLVRDDGFVEAARPARIAGPDALFDSARLHHAQRWQARLPMRDALLATLHDQLDACLEVLPQLDGDDALYFHRLALFHEDMHGEALTWLRATLQYPAPVGMTLRDLPTVQPLHMPGGEVKIGWPSDRIGFAFDNEVPGRTVTIAPFAIDAQPVSAGAFLRFVEAGGYDDPDFWPDVAGRWRAATTRSHPSRWRPWQNAGAREWQVRWFDRWVAFEPDVPVVHVNAFEAEAYCRWAGRRLPTPGEWEHAAAHAGAHRFHWGDSVWEWTIADFKPYPGFRPGPYRDYSQPWFGDHRELRGGSFATAARMHDVRYRNFFQAQRDDIFAGFRTVALA